MSTTSYIADAQLLAGLTARYAVSARDDRPAIPMGEVPYTELVANRSAEALGGATAGPAKPGESKTVQYTWQQVDPEMDRDDCELYNRPPLALQLNLEIEGYGRKIEKQRYDMRQPGVADLVEGEIAQVSTKVVPRKKHRQFWERFIAGDTSQFGLGYDGQTFFSTSHPAGDGAGGSITQSNLTAAVLALDETNLQTVVTTMMQYRDRFGEPFGNSWIPAAGRALQGDRNTRATTGPVFWLFVGSSNWNAALELADTLRENPSIFAGTFVPVKIDEIDLSAEPNSWYVVFNHPDTAGHPMKPLVFAEYETGFDSMLDQEHNKMKWFLRARWGFAYAGWHTAYKVTNA